MKIIMTKTMATAGVVILTALAVTTTVKSQSTSVATDADFEPSADQLRQAPANIAVVQSTHFPKKTAKIKHQHDADMLTRTIGRNVTFRDLIAEAYNCSPGQVVLPSDSPQGGFDFLVTVSPKTRKHLRAAIEEQLGYSATTETRDADVMVLQVKDSTLPGFVVSTNTDDNIDYLDGKLYFTDQPLSVITKGLEDGLALPVVDHTGLTNNYDFSVTWNEDTTQAMRNGTFHLEGVQTALNDWGLKLVPGHTNMEMFIVKKTR